MTAAAILVVGMAGMAAADDGSEMLGAFWAGDVRTLHVWVAEEPGLEEATATAALAGIAARRAQPAPLDVRVHVLREEWTGDAGVGVVADGLTTSGRAVVLRRGMPAVLRLHHVRGAGGDAAAAVLEVSPSWAAYHLLCGHRAVPAADRRPCEATEEARRTWPLTDFARGLDASGDVDAPVQSFVFTQAELGGPLSRVTLELAGTHGAIPSGATAHLEVLFNGGFVHAARLGGSERFALSIALPRALLQRENTVMLRLTSPGWQPVGLRLDPQARIHVEHGQRLPPGFRRFPQVLLPRFQASVDHLTPAALEALGQAVAAMQRASGAPLVPEIVPWHVGRASRLTWLAIATDPQSAAPLQPPLTLGPFRVRTRDQGELLRSDEGAAFAAVQAFTANGRDVLLLSHYGWPAGVSELARQLTTTGLQRLAGDVWVTAGGRLPFSFHAASGGVEIERLGDAGPRWLAPARDAAFALAASVLVIGLAWSYPRVVRPRPGL